MPATYAPAPDVAEIAGPIIACHHPHLCEMQPRIEFLYVTPTPKKNGKRIWGQAKKVSNLAAFFASADPTAEEANDPFFAVIISLNEWLRLSEAQKRALVDHELCHLWCEVDEDDADKINLSILSHDVEEFRQIVERHGLWAPDVKGFAESVQLAMPLSK